MEKLEKMDGKLFESLKPNEMSNLASCIGGQTFLVNGSSTYQNQFDNFYQNQNYSEILTLGGNADKKKIVDGFEVDDALFYLLLQNGQFETLELIG